MQSMTRKLSAFIFWSRWLQAPLYLGLIIVLGVYVYQFALGLIQLVKSANTLHGESIMLQALDLIDVVMIANLLIMVTVGGYETFVSRLHLHAHPDKPEWLDEVDAGSMKIKLALSLIGISSIHLLRTFINPVVQNEFAVKWQVIIHLTLIISAVAIAYTNKIISSMHYLLKNKNNNHTNNYNNNH
jgi:uncharacterized protein (TIGR00645 family)